VPLKTNKKMNFAASLDHSFHGISTLPSDNIKSIVNHSFEKTYLEDRTKRDQDVLLKMLLKNQKVRSQDTKAALMRNQAIKEKMEGLNKKDSKFKLKQFEDVKATGYISETTKDVKKAYKESVKKSNIETDSVLKIAELNKAKETITQK